MKEISCPFECLCHVWCQNKKKEDLPCYDPYLDSEEYLDSVDYALRDRDDYLPF